MTKAEAKRQRRESIFNANNEIYKNIVSYLTGPKWNGTRYQIGDLRSKSSAFGIIKVDTGYLGCKCSIYFGRNIHLYITYRYHDGYEEHIDYDYFACTAEYDDLPEDMDDYIYRAKTFLKELLRHITCLELSEKIHLYMKNLPKAEAEARAICNKWSLEESALDEQEREARAKVDEEQRKAREAQRKVDEERRKRSAAIYECRSKLDSKIYRAKNDVREFRNDCWRKKFRRFIADVLNEDAGITGKKIAENANNSGVFSKNISPYAVYGEWNDVKRDIAAGVFGENYPDNIVEEDTLEKSLETNHVIKDADLSKLLKKDMSIIEILDMLEAIDGAGSNSVHVIPDEDLAYENFMETDGSEASVYYPDVRDNLTDTLAEPVEEDSIVIDDLDEFF